MSTAGSPAAPLIFVVDDDPEIRRVLEPYLDRNGFEVLSLPSADDMLHRLSRRRPDLIVLDLLMPGTGGLEALRRLREAGDDVPVIVLTANSDEAERISGLEIGADDYMGKPFSARELLARIRAVLRRRSLPQARGPAAGEMIRIGAFVLDPAARTLCLNGQPVEVKQSDLVLLRVLASNPMKPLSRDRLLEMTGTRGADKLERSIDVQIVQLRRLLEEDPARPKILQTVRGIGYVFVPP